MTSLLKNPPASRTEFLRRLCKALEIAHKIVQAARTHDNPSLENELKMFEGIFRRQLDGVVEDVDE